MIANSSMPITTWVWNCQVAAAMASTSGWKVNSERNQTETVSR